MSNSKEPYKCESCKGDTFKIIPENTLFDENNTILFKLVCANCGTETENRINSNTLLILDKTKDKIDNLQMSMNTVLKQFNDIVKSKAELKETKEILNSINYINSIQQTIISLQKDKLVSNVYNSAYIIMHNLPKNIDAKDYVMRTEENVLFFTIKLTQIKPFKGIGTVELKSYDGEAIKIKVSIDVDEMKVGRSFNIYEPLGVYEVLTYLDMKINYPQKKDLEMIK